MDKKGMYKRRRPVLGCILILGLLWGCSEKSVEPQNEEPPPESPFKLSDFSPAESCKGCHPNHYNEWKGSMHAYAFIDPINTLWMEQVRAEVGAEKLGAFCVQCHSPIGVLTGETPAGFDKENVDPLVKEGVTCDACHLMKEPSPTAQGEARFHFDVKSGKKYGSIMDPAPNSFHESEGVSYFSVSNICLPCHDLVNHQGLPAEITYSEWLYSPYAGMGVECQDCHMETYAGQAAVGGPQREFLHRHDFAGVDIALTDNFPNMDVQRQRVEQLLRNAVTLEVEIPDAVQAGALLPIKATVINDKTGHDIPSSVTFVRQMWLEVTVASGADTIYKSGYFDADGDLMDEHSALNPNGDPDLVLFQSALFKNGQPANVFTADSIRIGSIAPFQSKTGLYSVPIPANPGSTINARVRLRFRPFPPYSIRDGASELIERIPVFEMAESEKSVIVL